MSHDELARSYLSKARVRLEALDFYYAKGAYSDVVREAQEAVEIALKGILWHLGVEPPKIHDVGHLILEYRDELPVEVQGLAEELARISKWLRKEREFALYGDVDLVPTAEYGAKDAERAMDDARTAVQAAERCVGLEGNGRTRVESGGKGQPRKGGRGKRGVANTHEGMD